MSSEINCEKLKEIFAEKSKQVIESSKLRTNLDELKKRLLDNK